MEKVPALFRSQALYATFIARIASFTTWIHEGVTLFAIVRRTKSFKSTYASNRWDYSCFEQTPLDLRYAFLVLSAQGRYALCKVISYNFVRLDIPF